MRLCAFRAKPRVAASCRLVSPKARADPRAEPEAATPISVASFVEAELDGDPSKVIRMQSSKLHSRGIQEVEKPVSEYMTLPASQYSVLDGAKVERLTDDTFRVNVSGFSFFSFEIEPIVTVSVQPTDTGCRIEMLACKLAGSPIIEAQNSKFSARMVNNVMWRPAPDGNGAKELVSDVKVSMTVIKPGWFVLPNTAVRKAGNTVISGILAAALPRFLAQLEKDYKAWAAGDDSRQALGSGEML